MTEIGLRPAFVTPKSKQKLVIFEAKANAKVSSSVVLKAETKSRQVAFEAKTKTWLITYEAKAKAKANATKKVSMQSKYDNFTLRTRSQLSLIANHKNAQINIEF